MQRKKKAGAIPPSFIIGLNIPPSSNTGFALYSASFNRWRLYGPTLWVNALLPYLICETLIIVEMLFPGILLPVIKKIY